MSLLFLAAACGKVGDIHPPFIRIPEAVKDLAATQSGYDIVLTWTNPPRYIDGSAATNLARVHIRSTEESIAAIEIGAAGQPQSYSIPVRLTDGEQTFTVVVETAQSKLSSASNAASIAPVEVPGRVIQLTAVADQRRIFLRWEKPQDHPELADAYIVTRTDIPAEAETVTDTNYEDVRYQQGKTFTYQVIAVRRVAGRVVAGVGPESRMVTAEDKKPPAPPTGLDIATADTGIVLTWDPNNETDVAGYHVFRSEHPDTGFKPFEDGLIMRNSFFDPSHVPGLYYAVSAVDESGNESPMSAPFRRP